MEATAGNGFYRGYVIKSVMNSAKAEGKSCRSRKNMPEKYLIFQANKHLLKKVALRPAIYLNDSTSYKTICFLCVMGVVLWACLIWMRDDRGETTDLIYGGMIVLQIWWIVFDDD